MKNNKPPSWDRYFITQCYLTAMKSKDISTKFGAVIVGPDNEPISNGYNNFPRGLNDDVPERQVRPLKYRFIEHSERNAIYNAARHGVALKGCRLYVPQRPCTDCVRGIIQTGIIEVIFHKEYPGNAPDTRWYDDQMLGVTMLEECGVKIKEWSGKILTLRIFCDGKEYTADDLK